LFGEGADDKEADAKRAMFIDRVHLIAKSYLDAKTALRQMLRTWLGALVALPFERRLGKGEREEVRRVIAENVARLIRDQALKQALEASENATNAASGSLLKLLSSLREVRGIARMEGELSEFETQVAGALNAGDGALALELLKLDDDLAAVDKTGLALLPSDDDSARAGDNMGSRALLPKGRRFSARIETSLQERLSAVVRGSLGGGRPSEGLEWTIEHCSRAGPESHVGATDQVQDALNSQLVNFAEKIVVLGNFAPLFSAESSAGVAGETREYVRVLQAIGNSIIIQQDENRRWERHQAALAADGTRVKEALLKAGFTNEFAIELGTTALNAKEVVAQLETVLRAEYAKALRDEQERSAQTTRGVSTTPGQANTSTATARSESTRATNAPPFTPGADQPAAALASGAPAGPQTTAEHTASLLAAIRAVTEMRQDLIYLRPASAYLRSSFPASTVMNCGASGWRNMLQQHALNQLPFADIYYRIGVNRRVLRELDNQSWQNVNQVRLAGSGTVNYAIAKDDIGNWYVKSYGADASNIYQSAIRLGAYASGGGFAPTLLNRMQTTATAAAGQAPSPVQKQFDAVISDYTNAVASAFTNLTSRLRNLRSDLSDAWTNNSALTTSITKLKDLPEKLAFTDELAEAEESSKSTNSPSVLDTQARSLLGKLLNAEKDLEGRIVALQLGDAPEKTAKESLQKLIRNLVSEHIDKRRQVIDRYVTSLAIVQKGLSP